MIKTNTSLSTIYVFKIASFTIWSCIMPTSIVAIQLKSIKNGYWPVVVGSNDEPDLYRGKTFACFYSAMKLPDCTERLKI